MLSYERRMVKKEILTFPSTNSKINYLRVIKLTKPGDTAVNL